MTVCKHGKTDYCGECSVESIESVVASLRPVIPDRPMGCICPPGSNKDCAAPLCPRRGINVTTTYAVVTPVAQPKEREQKLVDILFEIAVRMHQRDLKFPDREACAAYVADQLRQCGFDTTPVGSSWGVLK